jgi:hypothetical protein
VLPLMCRSLSLVAILMLAAHASPALAQPSAAIDGRAHVIFEAGRDAYEHGRYVEASEAFERVFAMTGHPYMLQNLGNCYAKLRQDAKAAAALHQYLLLEPTAPDRAQIEARITALQAAPAAPAQPAVAQAPGPLAQRRFTWVALGAGVVLGGVSAGLWIDANHRFDVLARTCGSHGTCSASQTSEVSSRVTATNVVAAMSLSALVTATVLWFVEGKASAANERVQLTAQPERSGASLLLQGRF